jgi:hypothetical protein
MRITARAAGNSQPVPELHRQSRPLLSLAHPPNAFPGASAVQKENGRPFLLECGYFQRRQPIG